MRRCLGTKVHQRGLWRNQKGRTLTRGGVRPSVRPHLRTTPYRPSVRDADRHEVTPDSPSGPRDARSHPPKPVTGSRAEPRLRTAATSGTALETAALRMSPVPSDTG